MDIITSFLHGTYYAGQLPSRVEYRPIASYLRLSGLVSGEQPEIEKKVQDAMAELHNALHTEEESKS